ncbi:duf614 domain-containing protein [Xylariaceae sp. FL0255]|nr:duf614 domain-containing protein [Xylariaceae sp. FL0255]
MSGQQGPIDNNDVQFWTDKVNDVMKRPGEVINSKSAEGASSWYSNFFGCFDPIDTCLITWCLPCVTFGKTHHQLHKDPTLAGYEPINTSCLLFCGSGCCGLWWIPIALQRSDIRHKHNIEGSCLFDIAAACCCHCCTLIQSNKEVAHRAQAIKEPDNTGYTANLTEMTYAKPAPQ